MEKSQSSERKVWRINPKFIPSKLSYFLYYGLLATYLPLMNAFFVSVGLSVSQAGFISGARMVLSTFAGPFWGWLADRTKRHAIIVNCISLGTLVTIAPMPWLARFVQEPCHANNQTLADELFYTTCSDTSTMFYTMLASGLVAAVFDSSAKGFIDAYIMALVKEDGRATLGEQRLFGACGFASCSFLASFLSTKLTISKQSPYTAAFLVFTPLAFLFVPVFYKLMLQFQQIKPVSTHVSDSDNSTSRFGGIKLTTVTYLAIVTVMGMSSLLIMSFLILFLDKEVAVSGTVKSLLFAVPTLAEAMFYPISMPFIRLVGGPINGILLALASHVVRFLLLSFIKNPWYALPIQCLHTLGAGLFWSSSGLYTHEISTEKNRSFIFSLVTSFYGGLGPFIGNMAGGVIFDEYSGRTLFRIMSGLDLVCLLVAGCIFMLTRKKTSGSYELKQFDEGYPGYI